MPPLEVLIQTHTRRGQDSNWRNLHVYILMGRCSQWSAGPSVKFFGLPSEGPFTAVVMGLSRSSSHHSSTFRRPAHSLSPALSFSASLLVLPKFSLFCSNGSAARCACRSRISTPYGSSLSQWSLTSRPLGNGVVLCWSERKRWSFSSRVL